MGFWLELHRCQSWMKLLAPSRCHSEAVARLALAAARQLQVAARQLEAAAPRLQVAARRALEVARQAEAAAPVVERLAEPGRHHRFRCQREEDGTGASQWSPGASWRSQCHDSPPRQGGR